MQDLRHDEVHTVFLAQGFSSVAVLQEGFSREVCFSSVVAQITDTRDRLYHLHHMEVIQSQAVSALEPDSLRTDSPNHLGQILTEAPLSIITKPS